MDPNDNPQIPGIGRGGRGAAILELLKTKNPEPGGFPGDISKQVPGISASIGRGTAQLPGTSGSAIAPGARLLSSSITLGGRGRVFSQLLKGRGAAPRGRGLIFGNLKTDVPSEVATPPATPILESVVKTEELTTEIRESTVTLQTDNLAKSIENLNVDVRQVVEYHGTSGKPTPVAVNCVKVKCQNEAVYQYHVTFYPSLDSRNMRYIMVNQHKDVIGSTKAFDGAILYLPKRLPQVETVLKSTRLTDNVEIKICIRLAKAIHPASHLLIPFYNTVLRRCMHSMKMCPVGRNYYDPQSPKRIEKLRLSLWPGYVTAIKSFEGGLLLNIDVSHKVLRSETARNLMQDIYRNSPNTFKETCMKELVGTVVLTRYNNKNYRVDDISWDLTPSSSFTNSKGESISFQDYYKIQYKIEIKDMLQPMLIHRPKKSSQRSTRQKEGKEIEICLVPELCFMTGLSDKLRNDFRVMKDIKDHTSLPPSERNASIEKFLQRVNSTPAAKEELLKWGLQLDLTTSQTNARNFPPEKVMVGRQQVFSCGASADFTREVTRSPVIRPVHLNNWILFFTKRDSRKAEQFYEKMNEVTGKLGMKLNQPQFVELKDDRSTTYKDAISFSINPSVQLIVCIFPTSRDDRYSTLKKLCCVDMPVASQVILSRTLPDDSKAGKFRSVTMKIALQINCKLGGELWAVDIPLKGLMVCGIDVYHDSAGRGNSVAAFVASSNKLMSRWYSRALLQQHHQEVIDGLKHCFTESIKKYYEVNHALPARIVIYRDGVGDGQLNHVSEHEIPQLESCFPMFENINNAPYNPKFTVVIVSKRINVRFFAVSQKSLENPPPGTVLDHLATRANWPDFFLVSQHVRQGTVSPTHYIVINGSEHLKPDHMQRLSYKLTHMYYNWPGTVRVPAPCQYAHKLAYLVGQSIRHEPSPKLCDRLFYL